MKKILIIDGMNIFVRSFIVVPVNDNNNSPIGGVIGFLRSLKIIIKNTMPDRVLICWDGKNGSKKRKDIVSTYKLGRKIRINKVVHGNISSIDDLMYSQLNKLKDILNSLCVTQLEYDSAEADDIISYLCKFYSKFEKIIVSTDNDMLQLLDNNTSLYHPSKKTYITHLEVFNCKKVLSENFIFLKMICGDKSDNIKGICGIGEKTVVRLFPFLSERICCFSDIINFAIESRTKNAKYANIADNEKMLRDNFDIMQLHDSIIDKHIIDSIKEVLNIEAKLNLIYFELKKIKYGVTISDVDFNHTFKTLRKKIDPC